MNGCGLGRPVFSQAFTMQSSTTTGVQWTSQFILGVLEIREGLLLPDRETETQVYFFLFVCLFFFLFFRDRVSLCSPGCPGTHYADQAGLELRNPPASASQTV